MRTDHQDTSRSGRATGRRRLAPVALALALGTALTACADPRPGDAQRLPVPTAPVDATDLATEPARSPTPRTAPTSSASQREPGGPERAYRAWLNALSAQDADRACRLQHPQLTIDLRSEAVLLDRAELGDPCVDFEALLWEDPLRSLDVAEVETTQDTGEKATLAVVFAAGSSTRAVTVQLEFFRGAWRVREESRRDGGSAGAAATERWVESWCDVSVDDTRDEIVEAMGSPSGEYTVADGGEPQLYWASDQYDFRAYLDPVTDEVIDLVGDYDALSAEDRAELTCPELR